MAEFTLKRKETETLRINLGEESFQLPLQNSMTLKEIQALGKPEGTYAYLKKVIPVHIFDTLSWDEYSQIVEVWKEESGKAMGIPAGES